jgi:hypothetical protein
MGLSTRLASTKGDSFESALGQAQIRLRCMLAHAILLRQDPWQGPDTTRMLGRQASWPCSSHDHTRPKNKRSIALWRELCDL